MELLGQKYENSYIVNKRLVKLPKHYGKLKLNIHSINESLKSFQSISDEFQKIRNSQKFGNKFAFMDKEDYVQFWGFILEINLGNKIVKRKMIQDFSSWKGWLIRRYITNYRLSWVIWQTVEGGFQQLWTTNEMILWQLSEARQLRSKTNHRNIMAYILDMAKGSTTNLDGIKAPKAMSFRTFWIILKIYSVLIICAIGMMVAEQFCVRIYRSRCRRLSQELNCFWAVFHQVFIGYQNICEVFSDYFKRICNIFM